MALVRVATSIGAVAGPSTLAPASAFAAVLGLPGLAGPYLVAGIGFTLAASTLAVGLRTSGSLTTTTAAGPQAAPAAGALGRQGVLGLGVLSVANLVMVSVMTMAPVQLHHIGSGLTAIGLVVSLHIAAMLAPSPVSGWLTDHVGAAATAAGAGALLLAASLLAAAAESAATLAMALVILGVGWNVALLSGSALLTAGVPPVAARAGARSAWESPQPAAAQPG